MLYGKDLLNFGGKTFYILVLIIAAILIAPPLIFMGFIILGSLVFFTFMAFLILMCLHSASARNRSARW